MNLELSILTLNIWGIPFVSKDRDLRIEAIGNELASGQYDIVSLQEVWSKDDFEKIRVRTENVLQYSHYFYSGIYGSGLCILSKYPIVMAMFHSWAVNGYVHRIQHGDYFGGKGVGLCKIRINQEVINVYIAHLHAEYNRENDDYLAHRLIQAFDTAQFIHATSGGDSILQILAGDLNIEPNDLAFRLLLSTSHLKDAYRKGNFTEGTNECFHNSYTSKDIKLITTSEGKRIDHILWRATGFETESLVQSYSRPMSEAIPSHKISYSDHEGVLVKFSLNRNDLPQNKGQADAIIECVAPLKESIIVCEEKLLKLETDRRAYIIMSIVTLLLLGFVIDIAPSYSMKVVYTLLKLALAGIIFYFIFMATMWHSIEYNGIMSGKLSMEKTLKNYEVSEEVKC